MEKKTFTKINTRKMAYAKRKMKRILHTENLSIGFNRKRKSEIILHKGINISLNKGEFVCLLGPNGAGKSTLIRTFVGFAKTLSGKVIF